MRQDHQTGNYTAVKILGDVKFTSSAFNLSRTKVVVLKNEHKDFCSKRTDDVGRSA